MEKLTDCKRKWRRKTGSVDLWIFVLSVMLISCASKPKFEGTSELFGQVTDSKNKYIANCHIILDGNKSAMTNRSGIFVFRDVPGGEHSIAVEREDYSRKEIPVYFHSMQQFMDIKVKNAEEVFSECELFLKERDLENAKKSIESLNASEKTAELKIFYEKLINYLEKPNEKKLSGIKNLMVE